MGAQLHTGEGERALPGQQEGHQRARDALGVPQARAGLVLPLAVAVFRMTSPVANLAVCLYVAQLHGVELSLPVLIAAMREMGLGDALIDKIAHGNWLRLLERTWGG